MRVNFDPLDDTYVDTSISGRHHYDDLENLHQRDWVNLPIWSVDVPMQQEELILIDSGAACHVCPRDWATSSSDADDTALKFRTASGATMKHFGRRCVGLQMKNVKGTGVAHFEVTEVRRPILSAGRLVDSGHALILDSQNPHLRRPVVSECRWRCESGGHRCSQDDAEGAVDCPRWCTGHRGRAHCGSTDADGRLGVLGLAEPAASSGSHSSFPLGTA